jgi:hypothetical protein
MFSIPMKGVAEPCHALANRLRHGRRVSPRVNAWTSSLLPPDGLYGLEKRAPTIPAAPDIEHDCLDVSNSFPFSSNIRSRRFFRP